jgi:hypothetical protein
MAGDGENLVYGFSTLSVNLPDLEGKLRTVDARLVGTVRGKPVVATWYPGGKNKLFMVTIIDSKRARFSDQEQNIIPIPTEWRWDEDILRPRENHSLQDSEHITRVLEVPAPGKPATESVLLLVNGTQNLWKFSLTETTDPKSNAKMLKAREVKRWDSSRRYINLDLIDLNAYVVKKEKDEMGVEAEVKEIPTAIAVWYQRENLFFNWNHYRNQANSLALANLTDDGLHLYQKMEEGLFPFMTWQGDLDDPSHWGMREGPDPYQQEKKKTYGTRCVTGGAFVNPDSSGTISYWFGTSNVNYWNKKKKHAGHTGFYLETWKYHIYFDTAKNRIMFHVLAGSLDSIWWWWMGDKTAGDANGRRARYIRHVTGPRIRLWDAHTVYIDNWLVPDAAGGPGANWEKDHVSQIKGRLHELDAPWDAVGVSQYDGIDNSTLTRMQINERRFENLGANVVMVVYGWPYFGVNDTPSSRNTPSFTRSYSKQKIKWTRSSNGGGFESEMGFRLGLARKYQVSAIGGSYWDKGDQTTTVETYPVDLHADYDSTQTSFERFKKWGLVVFNLIKPTVLRYGRFLPNSADPEDYFVIHAQGLEGYRFEFTAVTLGVHPDTNLEMRQFDMTNPFYEIGEERTPSPLSVGLARRDVHTVAKKTSTQDLELIEKWENDNKIKDFVDQATKPDTGLKVVHSYTYGLGENKTMGYSKTFSKEEFNSRSWYSGGQFKVEPRTGWGPVAALSGRYTDSFSSSDTTAEDKAYEMKHRAIDGLTKFHFKTYFIDVDIDKLQNFIIRSKGKPFEGKPAVIPDWNWNHKQDFTLVITVKDKIYKPR